MNGLMYLLNQTGEALAAAESEIVRLRREVEELRALAAESASPVSPSSTSDRTY